MASIQRWEEEEDNDKKINKKCKLIHAQIIFDAIAKMKTGRWGNLTEKRHTYTHTHT